MTVTKVLYDKKTEEHSAKDSSASRWSWMFYAENEGDSSRWHDSIGWLLVRGVCCRGDGIAAAAARCWQRPVACLARRLTFIRRRLHGPYATAAGVVAGIRRHGSRSSLCFRQSVCIPSLSFRGGLLLPHAANCIRFCFWRFL